MDKERFNELLGKIKCKENGAAAFTKLYCFYFPLIVAHIKSRYKDEHLGEDIAQDFFLKLLRKDIRKEIRNPLSWIFRSCRNVAHDYFEQEGRYRAAYVRKEDMVPDEAFNRVLFRDYLEELDKLDPETRSIMTRNIIDGCNLKEIAKELEIEYETVKKKFSRGKGKLSYFFEVLCLILYLLLCLK